MTHLHSFTAIVLALLASSCCAELVDCQLPPLHWNKSKLSGPTKQALDPLAYSELLNIVLVASVNGKFHALNCTTGHTVWSMSSSSSSTTVSLPSSLAPLVRTCHIDQDPDLTDDDLDVYQETYIIEPQHHCL
ncbi:hypothetical protein B0H14DRAFT_3771112 [Mycena olivaceomarginata]|nr:hypothetical protein B0H14DRAFT_3771112 [Mycena olivaceomarginata]